VHCGVEQSSAARRALPVEEYLEHIMNKDQVNGRVKAVKGKIKEVTGDVVGNERLEARGKVQKSLGKAQAKYGDVKKDVVESAKGF
jgi:uncharacterized protein YjbJ (UPF0337 family)